MPDCVCFFAGEAGEPDTVRGAHSSLEATERVSMTAVLQATNLTKRFGDLTAVDSVNLQVEPGAVLGFIGPNGAGKSTTIRMLLGLSRATSGEARLFNHDPLRDDAVRARVGYAPGELRLDERMTVGGTLRSWAKLRGGVDGQYRDELLQRFGVDVGRPVRGLSTGNRRKVALVGALMSRPELLVLDEPTNGLDPLMQNEFMTVLAEQKSNGTSVLLSSHILAEVEQVADRIAVIRDGKIVVDGPTAELRGQATQEFRVTFASAVPEPATFAGLDGVRSIAASSPNELIIHLNGAPAALLRVLGSLDVTALSAPEPDLATAFLSYYQGEAS